MLPYKYKIGSVEARNYVMENYEIKKLGFMELIKHVNGVEFHIGKWKVSESSVDLEITSKMPELNHKDQWAMDEICKTTQKRLENEFVSS